MQTLSVTNSRKNVFILLIIITFTVFSFATYSIYQLAKDTTEQTINRKSSGKNGKHTNQNAREAAKKMYEKLKKEVENLEKKRGKDKNDNKLLTKLKKQLEHWKRKMDNTGENHSQKPKGN